MLGQLVHVSEHRFTSMLLSPDYIELRHAITGALRDHPEAAEAVSAALHALETRAASEARRGPCLPPRSTSRRRPCHDKTSQGGAFAPHAWSEKHPSVYFFERLRCGRSAPSERHLVRAGGALRRPAESKSAKSNAANNGRASNERKPRSIRSGAAADGARCSETCKRKSISIHFFARALLRIADTKRGELRSVATVTRLRNASAPCASDLTRCAARHWQRCCAPMIREAARVNRWRYLRLALDASLIGERCGLAARPVASRAAARAAEARAC